jgi:hypothetical protein
MMCRVMEGSAAEQESPDLGDAKDGAHTEDAAGSDISFLDRSVKRPP